MTRVGKSMKSVTGISEVFSGLTKMTCPKSPAYCALVEENHKKSVMVETMK